MSNTIEVVLDDREAAVLTEIAQRAGAPDTTVAKQLLDAALNRPDLATVASVEPGTSQASHESQEVETPAERAAAFLAWIDSLPERGPGLPDEALSRESIYGDRS